MREPMHKKVVGICRVESLISKPPVEMKVFTA